MDGKSANSGSRPPGFAFCRPPDIIWNHGVSRLLSGQGVAVGRTPDKQIAEIEKTQEALRESIDQAKELAEKAQELLQKHKKTVERQSD